MSSLGPRERPLEASGHDLPPDPAVEALTQLIASEHDLALLQEPALLARSDPGRLRLLWLAIGATFEVCDLLGRNSKNDRDALFLHVADLFFRGGVHSDVDPIKAEPCLVELFESAGAAAVRACMRGDRRLGHYVAGLRVSDDCGTASLLS